MARMNRWPVAVILIVVSGFILSGCGRAGLGEARQACGFVQEGITLFHKSQDSGTSAVDTDHLLRQARSSFIHGEAHAARATSADGRWNALMTTLQLSRHAPVSTVVPTLTRQCKSILSDGYLY